MEERVQNIYQCAVCLKEFSRKSTCKSHMKLHTGERPHECDTCGMTFASKSNLNTHVLTHTHQKCSICGKTFTSKPLLKSHMIMHSSERPHECDLCGRSFKRKGELRSHMVTHTGEKRWKCQVCGNLFTERHSLKTHMRIHTGEKPYKCNVCEKTFARKSSFNSHSRMHTGVQPYKCFVCGKRFAHRSVMVSHSRKHMIKECVMCGMSFMKETELTAHIREHHQDEWPHRCNICGMTFSTSAKVKKHMRLHTESKPFRCDICSRQFLHKSALQSHIMTHLESEGKPTCNICGKSYTAKLSLEIHMRTHTGEKPFMCSVCGKQFTRKSGCLSHMRLHTGEKPYECRVCGKRFAYSSGIRSHMKLHNKAECSLCGVKLIGGIDPKNHFTNHVDAVGARCFLCDIEFKSISLFKHHLYKHEVNEREEQCKKNADYLGIISGETNSQSEGLNEEDFLPQSELPVLMEEETIEKKLSLPVVALLEAFPQQDSVTLTADLKTDGKKSDASHTQSLISVKQEFAELEDQEFFDMAILEVTKSDDPQQGVPSFKVTTHRHDREGPVNISSQDFQNHSQEIDFDTNVPGSPLRDIDSLESSLSPSALSNHSSPSPKSLQPASSIRVPSEKEIITKNATGEKEYSSTSTPSTSKIITISTSSASKSPVAIVSSADENLKHSIATHTVTVSKSDHVSFSVESGTSKAPSISTASTRKALVKSITCSRKIVKPVFKVKAGRKPGAMKVRQISKNVSTFPEFPQAPKLFNEEDVDLASSYSSYVKKMLKLIKPADKQLALIKALNITMDNFIEKYKSWK